MPAEPDWRTRLTDVHLRFAVHGVSAHLFLQHSRHSKLGKSHLPNIGLPELRRPRLRISFGPSETQCPGETKCKGLRREHLLSALSHYLPSSVLQRLPRAIRTRKTRPASGRAVLISPFPMAPSRRTRHG